MSLTTVVRFKLNIKLNKQFDGYSQNFSIGVVELEAGVQSESEINSTIHIVNLVND